MPSRLNPLCVCVCIYYCVTCVTYVTCAAKRTLTFSMPVTRAVFHAPMAALKAFAPQKICEPTNAKVDSGAECS